MRRSPLYSRSVAWVCLLTLLFSILPAAASDLTFTSDWLQLGVEIEPIPITPDNAELTFSILYQERTLKDGDTIPETVTLTADLGIGFKPDALPAVSNRRFSYALPREILVTTTDWQDLDNHAGRWRAEESRLLIEFDEAWLQAGPESVSVRLGFDFMLKQSAVLAFPGCEIALNIAQLTVLGTDWTIRLYPSTEDALPENAEARVTEVTETADLAGLSAAKLGIPSRNIQFLRAFDISLFADDLPIEPNAPVRVEIAMAVTGETLSVMHFTPSPAENMQKTRRTRAARSAEPDTPDIEVIEPVIENEWLVFESSSFSVFAVVGYQLQTVIEAADGHSYQITVTYLPDAKLPEDAALDVREILPSESETEEPTEYSEYLLKTSEALGAEGENIHYARFFDIGILSGGERIQPAEGTTVKVEVRLIDKEEPADMRVVHFGAEAEVMESVTDGTTVAFDASGFSVYAIVEAPEPYAPQTVADLTELNENLDQGFHLSVTTAADPLYFNSSVNNNRFKLTSDITSSAVWYFEPVENTAGSYYIYTYVGGTKRYMHQKTANNNNGMELHGTNKTAFTLQYSEEGKFYFKVDGQDRWLQYDSNGICLNTNNSNPANCLISLSYASTARPPDDVYGLDGKSFGIAYHDDTATAAAMSTEKVTNSNRLKAIETLMRYDVLNNNGILLVANDTDIPFWTFVSAGEDRYYITASVGGTTKYLTLNSANLTLADEPHETNSVFTATPGTGANSGKWHFTVGNYSLNLLDETKGFNGAKVTEATTWMNLLEKSVLTEEDFKSYTAKKVSVSDNANVYDGQQLIIYTRVWNDTTKKYDFYVVDHDGTLAQAYDTGDGIEWVGSQVNTALWDFTIYYDGITGAENYYYEFQNTQYGNYIAPQLAANQLFSGSTIGVNLNGRHYSENYSTIIAWDDASYAYSGLKVENGRVVPCALSEAEDFYFAVMQLQAVEELTTVDTVNNNQYGITMKMVDFNNAKVNNRDKVQNGFFGGDNNNPGLLSTNLDGNYPTATAKTPNAGKSLSELFSGVSPVNHLFIQSIYNESGYFEYDSTNNFAHLNGDGNFTVYDQLGAIGDYAGYNSGGRFLPTGQHGQFLPYNDLTQGKYCSHTNQATVTATELSDLNPRKGERLYNVGNKSQVDYFFGMELSASFTQTPSGKDAWGHDIIFEFSGDDDFWLYVDGELVLDLGGVHSAMTGSVNFRTGVVHGRSGTTTLYDVFRSNYQARGLSETEISEKLAEYFTQNEDGQYIFKDYTNHDMRIFYMERGAGASNLHMRFNLAAVRPGTFILSKVLSGTEEADNSLIEFPYQVWYKTTADGESLWYPLGETVGNGTPSAVYQGTSAPVTFLDSFTPAGGTEAYQNVFILKPGQSAEFTLPEEATQYYVVECGVNPDIYDRVSVNGSPVTGTDTNNQVSGTPRQDYACEPDTLENRTKVEYDNHVREGAMRTLQITKRLYDQSGNRLLTYADDDTTFTFRLYLGNENASADSLPLANLYDYHVLNPNKEYCRWDTPSQSFVSLGKTDYASLTDAERASATFTTSMYGSISKIPTGYTVEVRNLIIGTKYKVEERGYELPRGYTLRTGDGYTRVDVDPDITTGDTPYTNTMGRDETPEIEVRNQIGWGLTAKKVWTDADFMSSHDTIYFAIYLNTDSGLILYEDSVRALTTRDTSVYIFFKDLTYNGLTYRFDDYVVREVKLTGNNITVDSAGVVTGYDSITPISDGGTLVNGGQPVGGEHQDGYSYTVHYTVGTPTGRNENVRVDTVTNSRPGIKLLKKDWDGIHLSGAVFKLKDSGGRDVAAATYTSDSEGLITIAYLPAGTYTLQEIVTPDGYVAMDTPMTITVGSDNQVTVSGVDESYYSISYDDPDMVATIIIRNRPTDLSAKKLDADTHEPMEGIHFALYRQVTDASGNKRKDYNPMNGYSDLVTDENGILEKITADLDAGTYYLTELEASLPRGYNPLGEDLCFTIGSDGNVTIETEAFKDWVDVQHASDGTASYTILIYNSLIIPDPVSVSITGQKILNGRDMKRGEFSFSMTPTDPNGHQIGAATIVSCDDGTAGEPVTFTFPTLTYALEDYENAAYHDDDGNAMFYYLVAELVPDNVDETGFSEGSGIRYDRNRFMVTITLTLTEDRQLVLAKQVSAFTGE